MEFLKFVANPNVLPFLIIILMLVLVSLSIYGLHNCCRSKGAILEISEGNNDNVGEKGEPWSNLLIAHSPKNTDAENRNGCLNCGVICDPRKNKNKFPWRKSLNFSKNCKDVSHITPCSSWKDTSHFRDKAMPYQWKYRWFFRRKQDNSKSSICEDLQDLEESSLDLLISKLDSLVLTFKSSDASRSSATSLSSIAVDNVMAESEKCLSLITIN